MARATRAAKPALATFQRPLLQAEQFVATRYDTAQAKADFGNQLLAFIAEGLPQRCIQTLPAQRRASSRCSEKQAAERRGSSYSRSGHLMLTTCSATELRLQ